MQSKYHDIILRKLRKYAKDGHLQFIGRTLTEPLAQRTFDEIMDVLHKTQQHIDTESSSSSSMESNVLAGYELNDHNMNPTK